MSTTDLTAAEFETAFEKAGDYRYAYVLNRGLFVLYTVLLGSFWAYFTWTVLNHGADWAIILVGVILGAATVYTVLNAMHWRRFARNSAIVCEDERLLWRMGSEIHACRWEDVDFDALGLTDVNLSDKKYEHFLTIDGHRIYLFRPHVRLRSLEAFLGSLLLQLKARGRIPQKESRRKPKKRRKGGN